MRRWCLLLAGSVAPDREHCGQASAIQLATADAADPVQMPLPALTPGLTVVVCTYCRAASLDRFLESLAAHDRCPDELLVVDASPDRETARAFERRAAATPLAGTCRYWRVSGPLTGLPRQRNFALRRVRTDLTVFFDDDIVLLPGCLNEMERALRGDAAIVGVGGVSEGQAAPPTGLWRLRRRLGIVSSLADGRYFRSGMSTPWRTEPAPGMLIAGDWLPGCAMMWRTAPARAVQFNEAFAGYAQGEDLEFSLRMRPNGGLVVSGGSRVRHLHDPLGRPDPYRLGYMEVLNRYRIHQRALPERRWADVAWFIYAWSLDTALLARHLPFRGRAAWTARQMRGRIRAAWDLMAAQSQVTQ